MDACEHASFDGGVRQVCETARPDRYRHLSAPSIGQRRIARGGGYSYAAASFGAGALVQDCRAFSRVLAFDTEHGLLECEAGTTLGKVFRVAARQGWYLPVQPGYPAITLGGCLAADVHGKSQHQDGNFRSVVRGLRLFHPDHGELAVEPGTDLFDLTCGGLGLTGQVLSLRLQLARLPGHRVRIRRRRIRNLGETLAVLDEHARGAAFQYTWHDVGLAGDAFGRGFLYSGEFVPDSKDVGDAPRVVPIDALRRGRGLPAAFNAWTTGPFNRAYALMQALGPEERERGLFDVLFPVARRVVYFHLFGHRGFHESQLLVAHEAFPVLADELQRWLRAHPTPITLASCKLFRGEQHLLRFDGSGVCLALDFPRGPAGDRFLKFLDQLVQDTRGIPNLVKDSRLPRTVVEACYPEYGAFREQLRRFDPRRVYVSDLSERLAL